MKSQDMELMSINVERPREHYFSHRKNLHGILNGKLYFITSNRFIAFVLLSKKLIVIVVTTAIC